MSAHTYYVMHCVDGDECLIAHCTTLAQAQIRMAEEQKRTPRADLSIWTSAGILLCAPAQKARRNM